MGTGESVDYIWLEGTEGAAAAYYLVNESRGDYFHDQMTRIPMDNGGVIYSFSDNNPETIIYPRNYRYASVASTGWSYFNEKQINPFISYSEPEGVYSKDEFYDSQTGATQHRFYFNGHHFLTVIDDKGTFNIRSHPGVDIDGWGSSLYLQPFLPGAILNHTTIKSITIEDDGIRVIANGLVSKGNNSNYGNWDTDLLFSYNPELKEVIGNGDYNIALTDLLSGVNQDLNLYKLASNYLDDVDLLNGSTGDTGDMKYAIVNGEKNFNFLWNPSLQPSHFPNEENYYLSIETVGDYYQLDTTEINPAYKPSLRIDLDSDKTWIPMIFGGIYTTEKSQMFWEDNVGITPLILKKSTDTDFNFKVAFNSRALPDDGSLDKGEGKSIVPPLYQNDVSPEPEVINVEDDDDDDDDDDDEKESKKTTKIIKDDVEDIEIKEEQKVEEVIYLGNAKSQEEVNGGVISLGSKKQENSFFSKLLELLNGIF